MLVFPKLLQFEGNGEKIVRVAFKGAPPKIERSFRLFLEEILPSRPAESGLAFTLKMGLPIFVAPVSVETRSRIRKSSVEGGRLRIEVVNEGNQHLVVTKIGVQGIDESGNEVFRESVSGWYVLAGNSRPFYLPLQEPQCIAVRRLVADVTFKGVAEALRSTTEVAPEPSQCEAKARPSGQAQSQ